MLQCLQVHPVELEGNTCDDKISGTTDAATFLKACHPLVAMPGLSSASQLPGVAPQDLGMACGQQNPAYHELAGHPASAVGQPCGCNRRDPARRLALAELEPCFRFCFFFPSYQDSARGGSRTRSLFFAEVLTIPGLRRGCRQFPKTPKLPLGRKHRGLLFAVPAHDHSGAMPTAGMGSRAAPWFFDLVARL